MHIKLLPFEAEMFVHLHFKDPEFAGFCFCGFLLGLKNIYF